jgi:predicted RNase H-like HicB family nuclease
LKSPITASSPTFSKSCLPLPKSCKKQKGEIPQTTGVKSLVSITHESYKTILYRQEDGFWVAEIPAIPGCYALMDTRDAALAELGKVFEMIAEEFRHS